MEDLVAYIANKSNGMKIEAQLSHPKEQEMAAGATITAKGKQPIQATSVKEQTMTGGTRAIIFTFPKTQPITDEDKSVQFQEKKGALPTDVKQSFKLKDMHYDGKLTL